MGEHRERQALRVVGCWLLMLLLVLAVDAQQPPPMTTRGTRTHFSIQGGPKKVGPQTHRHNSVKSEPIQFFFHWKIPR